MKSIIIKFRFFIFLIFLLLSNSLIAQKIPLQKEFKNYTEKEFDSLFRRHPIKERIDLINKSLTTKFINFSGNDISLFSSLDLGKQFINDNGITAPINYQYSSVYDNSYKAGFTAGVRIDGIYKNKHNYSLSIAINRVVTGNYYEIKHSLSPFLDDYTHFKADNQFTTISIATHYKKLIPIADPAKYKFYAVIGPSFEYKISKFSYDNLVNGAANRAVINGDFGAEFDNNGYYTLFAHYKAGNNFIHSLVPIYLSRFEIGISIKAKDLL